MLSDDHAKAILYLTLDNSDLMLILLCDSYVKGTDIIETFHQNVQKSPLNILEMNLVYSFTVAAIEKEFLDSGNYETLEEEKIEKAYIYVIERKPGSIKLVTERLATGSVYEHESVLGCNDEIFVFQKISWPDFLEMFRSGSGLFNHTNDVCKEAFMGITTIISFALTNNQDLEEKRDEEASDCGTCDNLEEKESAAKKLVNKMLKLIDEQPASALPAISGNVKKYTYQLVRAIEKLENSPFVDYTCFSASMSIYTVLKIAEEVTEDNEKYYVDSFYDYMKGFYLYIQNDNHTDRQFIQSPGIDIKIYNAPSKLIAFYNAFIYEIKNLLNLIGNTNSHRYEFLTCLGVTDNMYVRELFGSISERQRVFMVNIPEKQMYHFDSMQVMLGHEVGHFVGQNIRQREERTKRAVNIMSRITVNSLRSGLETDSNVCCFLKSEIDENYWPELEKRLCRGLKEYLENLKTPDFVRQRFNNSGKDIEKICQKQSRYGDYTHFLRENILDGIEYLCNTTREQYFAYILEKYYLFMRRTNSEKISADKKAELSGTIERILDDFLGDSVWNKKYMSVTSAVDVMIFLFKECIADLLGILSMGVSMCEYLKAITEGLNDQGFQSQPWTLQYIIRTALVTYCMAYSDDDGQFCWGDDQLIEIEEGGDNDIKEKQRIIRNFIEDYINGEQYYECSCASREDQDTQDGNEYQAINLFMDSKILREFARYLKVCKGTFVNAFDEENPNYTKIENSYRTICQMHKMNKEGNSETCVLEMKQHIHAYRDNLIREADNIAGGK